MWRRLIALGLYLGLGVASLLARAGGGCVAAGSRIDTPTGPRPVETLHPGDEVWSLQVGQRVRATVQEVYAVDPAEFVELTAGDRILQLTPEHPVETSAGVFVRAGDLDSKSTLFTSGARVPLVRIQRVAADRRAYNLLVSPGGVFFANGLLVHNKGCFLPDTPITLADGDRRPISRIKVGDRVLAFTPDGLPQAATVRRVLTHEVESYLVVRTASTELHVTEEHPFYVGDGTFKTLEALHVGDFIHAYDGTERFAAQAILAMERRRERVTVYNLEVEGPHTYLANGIAVHNKGGGCFAPGTVIATPSGPRRIETLALGERVLAPDAQGRLVAAEISGVYLNFAPLLVLHTSRGDLRTTDEHPLLLSEGRFEAAGELRPGARLAFQGGDTAEILAMTAGVESGPVYTLQVAGPHTFIADGFVVHNKGGGGFRSSGHSYRGGGGGGGASSGGGEILPVIGVMALVFVVLVIISLRKGGGSDENLDFCFARAEIEPKANKTRTLLEFIARTDSSVNPQALTQTASDTFRQLQASWTARDYAPMQSRLMPDLYAQHCDQLRGLRQNHEINRLEDLVIEQVDLVHLNYTDRKENRSFAALFTVRLRDYYVDDRSGEFLRGDGAPARFQEFWTFQLWEGQWRLREIEQSRESDLLRSENFFESFTEAGRDQVYGEAAGKAGPLGPNLPAAVHAKDANIDRLLNFLYATDKIWDREAMLAAARRCYTGVLLAWQDGRPESFTGVAASPELLAHFRAVNEANARNHWRVEYRNLCVRKVEIIHVNNRHERGLDEFTARISAHAQVIARRDGAVQHQDEFVKPWVEYWTLGRNDRIWELREILPAEKGPAMLALENTDEGSSTEMLQWYYSKERAT
ncbi:MAG TPA: TIM44-like domain-containing protein [Lacunisphaera sp.]|nr:TIM44-like domain-containing protein [Lacunisphaera sp.]